MTAPGNVGRIGCLGFGYAVPATSRDNDDPVFDWIKKHGGGAGMFTGYTTRRVLAAGETIEAYMVQAAQTALSAAKLTVSDVDVLLGYTSISAYQSPNSLVLVHQLLGLAPTCWPIPVHADFSNYSACLLFADALIAAGRARNVLIVCGANWSRFVSYQTPECISAGDGAGAVVVGATSDVTRFRVADYAVTEQSASYGAMTMQADVVSSAPPWADRAPFAGGSFWDTSTYTQPYFRLSAAGGAVFSQFGVKAPPALALHLLQRNGVDPADVTVIPYQASAGLLDARRPAIGAAALLDTLSQFANMTSANLPVNAAYFADQIQTDYVVLLGLGPDPHASALLLRRNG